MRQFSAARLFAASLFSVSCLSLLMACGGTKTGTPVAASIVISPSYLSLNVGQVQGISATAYNSTGGTVAVDMTFSSSDSTIASVSSGGAVCGGTFDSNNVVCSPAAKAGQATITATSGSVSASITVYVHLQVDRVDIAPIPGCSSMGTLVTPTALAYNTTAPGCSTTSPCDITSTVGPITIGSNDFTIVSNAAGINPTYNSSTKTPVYISGGSITGTSGQTCNLDNFSVGGSQGIDPNFDASANSPTYSSGGTITGSGGQTCTLSNFNNVTGATATVTLTGTNVIASGTQLTILNQGFAATAAPTTATLTNGTATCSGTANVTTKLALIPGGSPVIGATGTVALTGKDAIANGTQLTITNQGYGATTAPTTARLSNGSATCSGIANIATSLNSAVGFKAQNPGQTTIFGSVAGVNSVGQPFTTCPVASINVHDLNSGNTTFNLAPANTQILVADVLDTSGASIFPSLTWGSSPVAAASVAGSTTGNNQGTITAVAPGTASITAICASPNCNKNLPSAYGTDVITANVSGTSSTTVYAASTKSTSLIPIPTSTNAPGTAITLPNLPNSIMAAPNGKRIYLGSSSGVMVVDVASGSAATLSVNGAAVTGAVVAISPDSNYLMVVNSTTGTFFVNVSSAAFAFSHNFAASSGVFAPNSSWLLMVAGQSMYRDIATMSTLTTPLGYQPNSIDVLAQGSLAFITNTAGHAIDVRSTCDQSDLQSLAANAPTLVRGLPNGKGAIAVDSPAVDVVTTGTPSGYCPVVAQNTLNSYDLGAGNFTARQLFVNTDSSRAWITSDLPDVLSFNLSTLTPTIIPLANGAVAYTGGVTMDGALVYVGATDNNVHLINVGSMSDTKQIAPGLKDSGSNVVAPDLVTVLPK